MGAALEQLPVATRLVCKHCGKTCGSHAPQVDGQTFCCYGCATAYTLINDAGLCAYYADQDLNLSAPKTSESGVRFDYLADATMAREVSDFYSDTRASTTFHIPTIHCSACVYVLENLPKLKNGILQARIDFVRKELSLDWDPGNLSLKEIALLLTNLGYEPIPPHGKVEITDKERNHYLQGLVLRLGVVGFCTGNLMLVSFPDYFGLGGQEGLATIFLALKIGLSIPVITYGAWPFWLGVWQAYQAKRVSVDVPLALGIFVLFVRSALDIALNIGEGYLDSLSGLVFFLLIGRWVQARSFDHLRFSQTLDTFFPLAAKVIDPSGMRIYKKADALTPGELIEVQSELLIPADGTLKSPEALIDYSFATGESKPTLALEGEHVFAGGRLMGQSVQIEVEKSMIRSRFMKLWNKKELREQVHTNWARKIENAFSTYFTLAVLVLAGLTAFYWTVMQSGMVWNTTTAVLLVACPCALSLAMPFATHAAMQFLAQQGVYLKSPKTLQELAGVQSLVFDKTGTLTESSDTIPVWEGEDLSTEQISALSWMVGQSAHPLSVALDKHLPYSWLKEQPYGFQEKVGQGIEAVFNGKTIRLGNWDFVTTIESGGPAIEPAKDASTVFVSLDGRVLGQYLFYHPVRKGINRMYENLVQAKYGVSVLSGDNQSEQAQWEQIFPGADIVMEATPEYKLTYIAAQKTSGERIAMVGDGMNDAGAFAAADIGIAVREDIHNFSPTCDVILEAKQLVFLPAILKYAKKVLLGVDFGFGLSLVFNAFSLTLAATGMLNPMVAALLMPASSLTVVLFSIALVNHANQGYLNSTSHQAN